MPQAVDAVQTLVRPDVDWRGSGDGPRHVDGAQFLQQRSAGRVAGQRMIEVQQGTATAGWFGGYADAAVFHHRGMADGQAGWRAPEGRASQGLFFERWGVGVRGK